MTSDQIATEIYQELDKPSDLTESVISYWVRTNLGSLNSLIYKNYTSSCSGSAPIYDSCNSAPMGEGEKGIYKKLYLVNFYDRAARKNLGAASLSPVVEVSSDGATVRKINRTELSKTYFAMKKDANEELDRLLTAYRIKYATPNQVAGDDTIAAYPTRSVYYAREAL